mmetsp:Transcript_10129/g.11237  ORF Transcript_10129/g.11237 Transcript_10129/m.11237 type:complete len:162 (-) Transcript_10129:3-488(-)
MPPMLYCKLPLLRKLQTTQRMDRILPAMLLQHTCFGSRQALWDWYIFTSSSVSKKKKKKKKEEEERKVSMCETLSRIQYSFVFFVVWNQNPLLLVRSSFFVFFNFLQHGRTRMHSCFRREDDIILSFSLLMSVVEKGSQHTRLIFVMMCWTLNNDLPPLSC